MPEIVKLSEKEKLYTIGSAADKIYILKAGRLNASYKNPVTGQMEFKIIHPGEFFGICDALWSKVHEYTIYATTDSECLAFTLQEFEETILTKKSIVMDIFKGLTSMQKDVSDYTKEKLEQQSDHLSVRDLCVKLGRDALKKRIYISCFSLLNQYQNLFPELKDDKEIEDLKQLAAQKIESGNGVAISDYVKDLQASVNAAKKKNTLPLEKLAMHKSVYDNGELISLERETSGKFYHILTGQVIMSKFIKDKNIFFNILGPGDFILDLSVLTDTPRPAAFTAMGLVTLLEFERDNFEQLVTSNPKIALIILKHVAREIAQERQSSAIMNIPGITGKVAETILYLCKTQGEKEITCIDRLTPMQKLKLGQTSCQIQLSIHEIAVFSNTTTEDVEYVMEQFESKLILTRMDDLIIVFNTDRLSGKQV